MRDIERIDKFCKELAKQWKRYPDFRFGQFISNVMGIVVQKHGDIWFPEENEMIKYIEEAMDELVGKD